MELTEKALDFLRGIFTAFDMDGVSNCTPNWKLQPIQVHFIPSVGPGMIILKLPGRFILSTLIYKQYFSNF